MISFLVVFGLIAGAFVVMAAGLHFSRYKRRNEDDEACLTCPIRTLLNLHCKKTHQQAQSG